MSNVTMNLLSFFSRMFAERIAEIFAKKTDIPRSLPANGGNASTVNGHSVNADVPDGAVFTDTVYIHPDESGNKHIPAGGTAGQVLKCTGDGTAEWGDEVTEGTEEEIRAIIAETFKEDEQ